MISQVTIKVLVGEKHREIWFLFETDHPSLFEFNEDLATDGTVFGQRIDTEAAGGNKRREVGRYDYIVGRDAVVNVSPPQVELVVAQAAAQ